MQTACLVKGYQAEIKQIVVDVFSAMLHMDVEAVHSHGAPAPPFITSAVHFVGSWKGALRIECTVEQTFEITRRS